MGIGRSRPQPAAGVSPSFVLPFASRTARSVRAVAGARDRLLSAGGRSQL